MSNSNVYTVIGIMSGTSMDGIDLSLIQTNGIDYTKVILENSYEYSKNYKLRLKKLIKNLPESKKKQFLYVKKNQKFITNNFLKYIKKFIKLINPKLHSIDLIGLSGQTIYHNPSKKYSIQLGSGSEIYKKLKVPIITNFRQKDLLNGGEGAPIGSFYHKSILDKIENKACIINLGGIANITFSNKKNLISFDLGPANLLIDDLSNHFYKRSFDNKGTFASKGKMIIKIFNKFNEDRYFKKKYPKSLDRGYFNSYFKELINYKANDSIHTATMLTIISIINGLKLLKNRIEMIILTGGGRKNLFMKRSLKKELKDKNIKILDIESFGLNGDMVEAQMFGYLAVRSIKKLPLSLPSTTGVIFAKTGGIKYGRLIKN